MLQETQQKLNGEGESITKDEELDSLENRFIVLSEKFKTEKEAYDKKVLELENKIKQLKEEIIEIEKTEELKKQEQKEVNVDLEPIVEEVKENNSIEEILDNTTESLSVEEKEILETEMENNEPLGFENEEVKTNIKTFLRNEMVKNLSGLKMPEKIKNILRKSTKYILSTAVIATMWSGTNEKNPLNSKDFDNNKDHTTIIKNNDSEKEKKTSTVSPFTKTESNEFQVLPENVREIHSYAEENIKDSYIVIDKPSATLYVFNENNEIVGTMPVLLGKTKGEAPNRVDVNDEKAVGSTTPAGKYKLGKVGKNFAKKVSTLYEGRLLKILGAGPLAIHMTYPEEFKERTEALNTKSVEDNRKSWGCINISPENFDKYIKPYFSKGDQFIFITPDDTSLTINAENGKIEKINQNNYASNINNNYQQTI